VTFSGSPAPVRALAQVSILTVSEVSPAFMRLQ
jgi:hypothetical protein